MSEKSVFSEKIKKITSSQLIIPIVSLLVLVIFNLFRDPSFFSIMVKVNNDGNKVLAGNVISILNGASELVILSIGMTLITAATKGQDISIGATAAIAGSVFVKILRANEITFPIIFMAFFAACIVAILFCLFNGALISFFNIQPMIASLILFTAGRPIAYWINGGASPSVQTDLLKYFGSFIPGCPIPSPVLIVILFIVIISLLLKFTNISLYMQAVGINERAAKLNGINPILMKMIAFIILGICVAMAGAINVSRVNVINHDTCLLDIEMDAILAVAIGGNSLSGGKFKISGSIIGAYIIQALTVTLYAMKVSSTAVRAYKAVVIIIIVIVGSPTFKKWFKQISNKIKGKLTDLKNPAVNTKTVEAK